MIHFLIDRLLEPFSPVPVLAQAVYSDEHMGWVRKADVNASNFMRFLPGQAVSAQGREEPFS